MPAVGCDYIHPDQWNRRFRDVEPCKRPATFWFIHAPKGTARPDRERFNACTFHKNRIEHNQDALSLIIIHGNGGSIPTYHPLEAAHA